MQPGAFDGPNDVWTVLLIFPLYACHSHEAGLKPATCHMFALAPVDMGFGPNSGLDYPSELLWWRGS